MRKKLRFLVFVSVSVFLLHTAFGSEFFWWLSLFALVPLFILVSGVKNKKSAFFTGWLVGTSFFLFNLEWFLGPHYTWWGKGKDAFFTFVAFSVAWAGSAAVLGLSFGFFALVLFLFELRKTNDFFFPLFLSSAWIFLEYLRSWLFCFWSWGSESIFGPYWTFGHLGYALVNSSASVLARCVGLYGLSFLVILVNILIFKKKFRVLAVLLLFVFVVVPLVAKNYFSDKVFRTDILQAENSNVYYNTATELLKDSPLPENTGELPRIIVFPEGSNFFSNNAPQAGVLSSLIFGNEKKGLIVSSAVYKEGDSKYEEIIYADKDGNILERQKKNFLISAGEYMPYAIRGPLNFFSLEDEVAVFDFRRHFSRGDEAEKVFYYNGTGVGSLVCSGILSPVFYRNLAKDGAEILVNPASHQIFGHSKQGLFQMKTFARFQAIANARPFLQSAFGGYAFVIDANGNFTAGDFNLGTKFVSGKIEAIKEKTLYTKLGDWPLVLAFFVVLFGVYLSLIYNKRNVEEK